MPYTLYFACMRITTHPREGTETRAGGVWLLGYVNYTSSPQGVIPPTRSIFYANFARFPHCS